MNVIIAYIDGEEREAAIIRRFAESLLGDTRSVVMIANAPLSTIEELMGGAYAGGAL